MIQAKLKSAQIHLLQKMNGSVANFGATDKSLGRVLMMLNVISL